MLSYRLPALLSRTTCTSLVIGASSPRRYASTTHPPGSELLSSVWTHGSDIVVDRAEGSWVHGTDGKKYRIKSNIILQFIYYIDVYVYIWILLVELEL